MKNLLKNMLGVALTVLTLSANAASYNATDIGYFQATGINDSGQVIGNIWNGQGILYSNGSLQPTGTLGGIFSNAYAINNNGQVTGGLSPAASGAVHAFIYANGNMVDINPIGGSYGTGNAGSSGTSINNFGQVTGEFHSSTGSSHAFLYSNGSMQDLGTLGGAYSYGTDINDKGQVVGESSTSNGSTNAFIYNNANIQNLGTLGGTFSSATSINNNGDSTGYSSVLSGENHAFLYTNDSMQDLGTLGGNSSIGQSINNLGQVTGWSLTSGGVMHAFLYENGTLTDLNSLVSLHGGVYLQEAMGINNAGQIIAWGTDNHAYLLSVTAVPEPDTYAMLIAGLGLMGFAARRKQA